MNALDQDPTAINKLYFIHCRLTNFPTFAVRKKRRYERN